ncbi:type II toxin-antitoxin system prevent-host-death family antitoxin [Pseudolysinimonas sp.]|uniref:type II toxin-antitoxin system Phd/YefM family antitoxin n=1 Tax=Pseudolysinimonas sp. TaxID=2680009 RepID=UPI00286D206C|nr:type II toxin-antitoxin system prevent-host-death family antitoxin [Pseudolysinimonas sp.]
MISVSLTEARARLPELLTRAAEGEEIHILRHGRAVGVLIGHARWVKTQQHDVLIQAKELRKRIEAARGKPLPSSDELRGDPANYDRYLRELRDDGDVEWQEQWGD